MQALDGWPWAYFGMVTARGVERFGAYVDVLADLAVTGVLRKKLLGLLVDRRLFTPAVRQESSSSLSQVSRYRDRALNPADVQDIVNLMHAAGRDLARYNIKVSGNPTKLEEFAAAGPTWWSRWIPPGHPADARKVIADGPPSHGRPWP